MNLVVLAEMRALRAPSMQDDYVQEGEIVAIHAAAVDPTGPGTSADTTLCGANTAEMKVQAYQPTKPDAMWYPQNLEQWACQTCDQAVGRTAS